MNDRASMHIYAKFMIDNLNIFSGGPEERRRIFRKKIRYDSVQPEGKAKKRRFSHCRHGCIMERRGYSGKRAQP
ncbi:hypothetical protein [Dickeya solani]|uniref:Uncharacterized protein n=2 Tax=Dickeya solani TaxID=1089444 RepID=A0ABU4ECS2_9GAMM|nr:hypothetical protein [Dickeya solani]MCA7001120.1 hypothetical protein [Dickeya solani]MCZ0821559.1 hypothetical protein [Dickeya solani]MDV6996528.1 hypothetical protein [Dickeya solani]MDV7002303.1 hypothetical protein [Dickeya solani]MDV7037125.1 hypothetical protein [Dickeya solani]